MRKSKSLLCKVVSLVLVLMLMMATVMVAPFSASAASTYYLRGTFNNWEERSEYALTDNGNGTFSITVTLQAGTHKYKVARDGWNWSVPSQDATLTLAEGGLVKFTMNPTAYTVKAETVSAPTQAIYLRGSFDGEMWPATEENKLESLGNNNFYTVKTLPAGTHEYKFAVSDWSWATPAGDNAKLTLSKESQVLFEVNALTGAYNATVLTGDTKNLYTFEKAQNGISIQSAWSDHADQVLCEKDGKLSYISLNDANFSSANTTWNFIPGAEL